MWEMERLRAELESEKKAHREVERSQADGQGDIKSLNRQLGIAKKDAEEADGRLNVVLETIQEMMQESEEWMRTCHQLTADMEKLSKDNRRLGAVA
jgi:chromosome segregation ATPase